MWDADIVYFLLGHLYTVIIVETVYCKFVNAIYLFLGHTQAHILMHKQATGC